jgi:putative endonuclease
MRKHACVYILASGRNGTLYVGVTSDISGRVSLHKQDLLQGFTKTYGVHRLVYVEFHDVMEQAIAREKQLKRWKRAWKVELIERENPEWRDLYWEISGLIEI